MILLSQGNHSAEDRFRSAFERLKANKPIILPIDSKVTQNNVAKEAGRLPSALKKNRYPSLIREIQAYVEIEGVKLSSAYQKKKTRKIEKLDSDARIKEISVQRDMAQSKLISARKKILDLMEHINRLNVLLQRQGGGGQVGHGSL